MRSVLLTLLTTTLALTLTAQTHPLDFGTGPARWLMTSEEQAVWRNVKTDHEAIDFIDLFFARRDPTPGTPRNEFRTEFERRVAYADANFKEGPTRGSLTERGRVLVILGFPKDTDNVQLDPTGYFGSAAKETWTYRHEAAEKFGMPKIEVVFIFDRGKEGARRDPQRADFSTALPGAIKSYIVSPDLKTVPEWGSSRLNRSVVKGEESVETTVTRDTTKKQQFVIDTAPPIAKQAGAGKLILLANPASLQPQSGRDPFSGVTSLTSFKRTEDLGWAAEYCSGERAENPPAVTVQIQFDGKDGKISSDPEEFVPDSIKGSPGCYLVRGSVPLADVDPGLYTILVTITGQTGRASYNLTREFRVE